MVTSQPLYGSRHGQLHSVNSLGLTPVVPLKEEIEFSGTSVVPKYSALATNLNVSCQDSPIECEAYLTRTWHETTKKLNYVRKIALASFPPHPQKTLLNMSLPLVGPPNPPQGQIFRAHPHTPPLAGVPVHPFAVRLEKVLEDREKYRSIQRAHSIRHSSPA